MNEPKHNSSNYRKINNDELQLLKLCDMHPHFLKAKCGKSRVDLIIDRNDGEILTQGLDGIGEPQPVGINIRDLEREASEAPRQVGWRRPRPRR